MVDFKRILDIRARKLEDQRREEKQMLIACAAYRQKVQDSRIAMENYMEEIKTLEIDLLNEFVNQKMAVPDLNKLQAELDKAEDKATRLSADYTSALEYLKVAEKAMEEERRKRFILQSKHNKISEIHRIKEEEAKNRSISAEEAAIDDFVETMFVRQRSG
jgi:hypothetical protein